jgi:hypothetical protein
MTERTCRTWLAVLGFALIAAISPAANASMGGVDHLADNLSVTDFSVNGSAGFRAGDGGASAPSPVLPEKWHAGLTVHVVWAVRDWEHNKSSSHEADVPVDPYTEDGGDVLVHFLANGTVRVVVSDIGPRAPNYPGPHDAIPLKRPWDMYPTRVDDRDMSEQLLDDRLIKQQCANASDPKGCESHAEEKLLDEQLTDARRYLPRCAPIATAYLYDECERQARRSMSAARLARRCEVAPGLPECAIPKAAPNAPKAAETTGTPDQ